MTPRPRAPEPLADSHDVSAFACGRVELDDWLKRRTRSSEGLTARTYVVADGDRVVGYYCLSAGAVERGELPKKNRRDTPNAIPIAVIGRLAVDSGCRGTGIGMGLLKDAILRTMAVAGQIGIRAVVVHALDDAVAGYYARLGFVESPLSARTLVLPLETAKAALP